jgi:hypothetical protein
MKLNVSIRAVTEVRETDDEMCLETLDLPDSIVADFRETRQHWADLQDYLRDKLKPRVTEPRLEDYGRRLSVKEPNGNPILPAGSIKNDPFDPLNYTSDVVGVGTPWYPSSDASTSAACKHGAKSWQFCAYCDEAMKLQVGNYCPRCAKLWQFGEE